jgi:hypothetical protein
VFVLTSQVKIPYYPKVEAHTHETTFGATEVSCPQIYETPLSNIHIVRVDLLECLRDVLGDNCFIYRDNLYKLLAGSCTKEEHVELFASYYRTYKGVTTYVNNLFYYGETDVPIIVRTLEPLRDKINEYRDVMIKLLTDSGGKYLLHTHDYLYYGFRCTNNIPDVKGLKVIC